MVSSPKPFRRTEDNEPEEPLPAYRRRIRRSIEPTPEEPPSDSPIFDRATCFGIQGFIWGLIVGIGILTLALILH